MGQYIRTMSPDWLMARTTNSTDANYRTVVNVKGRDNGPTGNGSDVAQATSKCILNATYYDGNPSGGGTGGWESNDLTPNGILLCPFGTGADATTFLMRVLGWNLVRKKGADPTTLLWQNMLLGEYTCSLSLPVGIAGAIIDETNRFCDTIVIVGTSGSANAHDIITPTTNLTGTVLLDLKGAHRVELNFDRNSSASSCNALYKWVY